jgi:hypothetical protein
VDEERSMRQEVRAGMAQQQAAAGRRKVIRIAPPSRQA